MGIIIKQSIRNALISYVGVIIGFISTIKLFPNILETSQFGLTRTMIALMVIGTQAISLGLPSSVVKFFPYLSSKTSNSKGIFTLFSIPVLLSFVVFSLVFILFKEIILSHYQETPLISDFYYFILPLILFSAFFGLLNSYISARLDTVFASFLNEISLRLIVIADLILFFFNVISFESFILIFVGNYGLQFIILLLYGFKRNFISFSLPTEIINTVILKRVGKFSLYSLFGGLTMMIVGNIDMLMLSAYEGLSETGIYAIAFYVGSVISIPRKAVSKISYPIIAKAFEFNNHREIETIYKQTSLNQFLVGLLLFIGVWANMDNLYAMLPEEYSSGSLVILFIGIANLFDMINGANGQIITSSSYYRFGLYFAVFLVIVTIMMNMIFIPMYGILGAAIATATAIFIYNLIKFVFVWVMFSIQPFSWKVLAVIANGIFVLCISFYLPQLDNLYLDISYRSILITLVYSVIIWVFNLSDEFKDASLNIFKRILSYIR